MPDIPNAAALQPPLDTLVKDVLKRYAEAVPHAQWVNERERWYELIACILLALGGPAAGQARRAAGVLHELGLLEIADLAAIAPIGNSIDAADPHLCLMHDVLFRLGYSANDIVGALRTLTELARDLEARYQGRIQRYLRDHGTRMLNALRSDFPSASTSETTLQRAFALWLQNVLVMPVFVDSASTEAFCAAAGCSRAELAESADRLDVNAALLDDVLDLWQADREQQQPPRGDSLEAM